MADSGDPKIVIRTEFDSKGIFEAERSYVQMSQDLQKHMEYFEKQRLASENRILKAQMRAGKEATKAALTEYQKRNEALQRIAEAGAARDKATADRAAKSAAAAYQRRNENIQRVAEAGAKAEAARLDREVRDVEKAEDAKFKIRLANEQKIRDGLNRMRSSINDSNLQNRMTTDQNGGGGLLQTVAGAITSIGMPGGLLAKLGAMATSGLVGAANAFKSAMGGAIEWIGRTIQITIGVLLRDIVRGFINGIQDGIRTAIDATSGMERTLISLNTQGRLENEAAGMSPDKAIAAARVEATRYLAVIRELAIYSPFQVEDIQNIYKTYAAYGLTRGAALSLTRGMVDLASAFGATGEQAQRASLAVAQIMARGRATGEEIRQLVNSGLPLMTKLADVIGVTQQEFSRMAKEGELTSEVIVPALNEIFDTFAGAGKEASMTTFTGLLSSIADIGPILLQEFFAPINQATGEMGGLFGALIPILRDVVNFFTDPKTIKTVRVWGDQLGKAFTDIFGKAKDAFSWGYNLMVQYGNGIIAAGRVVLRALANIGRLIMKMLKPNSPPLILPDIDTWGKETMEQWLMGFTQADASSVFSGLSSELGSLMKGMLAQVEDKAVMPNMLRGLNESLGDLVKAYASGSGLQEAQLRITSMFGSAAPVVQNYVQALLNAQTAATAVAGAERNLANVTKYYEDQLSSLDAQIKALQNTQKDIGDDVEKRKLNLILNSQFVSEDRKAQARARLEELRLTKVKRGVEEERDAKVSAAQAALDAAKLEQEKRAEQLSAAKAMLDFYQMQNDLLNDQIDAMEELTKAIKDLAGAAGDAGDGLGLDEISGWFDELYTGKQKSQGEWDPFGPWREEMDGFGRDWNHFWLKLQGAVQGFVEEFKVYVYGQTNPASQAMATVTESSVQRMIDAWNKLPEDSRKALIVGVVGWFYTAKDNIETVLKRIQFAFDVWKSGMVAAFSNMATALTLGLALFSMGWTGDWSGLQEALVTAWTTWKTDMMTLTTGLIKESEEAFGPWAGRLAELFAGVKSGMTTAFQGMVTAAAGYVNDMIGLINKLIGAYNAVPWLPDVAEVSFITVPTFQTQPGTPGKATASSTVHTEHVTNNNFNLGIKTDNSTQLVARNFQSLQMLSV